MPPSPSSLVEQTKQGTSSRFSSPKLRRLSGNMGTAVPEKRCHPLSFRGGESPPAPDIMREKSVRAGDSPSNGEDKGLPRGSALFPRLLNYFRCFHPNFKPKPSLNRTGELVLAEGGDF